MRFARSPLHLIVGIVVLILMLAVSIVMVDERLSRQLDNVDPTAEEMTQQIPFGGEK
jgi:uncharacterized protein YoxC